MNQELSLTLKDLLLHLCIKQEPTDSMLATGECTDKFMNDYSRHPGAIETPLKKYSEYELPWDT